MLGESALALVGSEALKTGTGVVVKHYGPPLLRADSGSLDSGIRSYLGQASEHDTDHGEADEGNDGGGVSLEVASEPAIASDPGKGALDDPSLGQDDELVGFTPFDDFKLPSTGIGNDLCDPWPLIGGISEELGD